MNKTLETALYWYNFGVSTIPIQSHSKQPRVKWLSYTEQLPTQNELNYWFGAGQNNIAIITGWKNLCIIDFDDMDVFMKWYFWALNSGGKYKYVAQNARIHRSARGAHVYTLCENAENMKLPKIDVLAQRKYALLPPSVHPSGAVYSVYRDTLPMPVKSLYDVLPKRMLDDALAQKATANTKAGPTPSIPSKQSAIYDPWEVAGQDQDGQKLVDAIKEKISISSILSGWVESGGNGRWKVTRCPFHDDHNPSFWYDTKNELCGCHAGCTPLPLDVIDLYARLQGIDNVTAIRELAKRL